MIADQKAVQQLYQDCRLDFLGGSRVHLVWDGVVRMLAFSELVLTIITAGVINSIVMFVTFLVSLPALALPSNKGWIRAHSWMVVISALFTLALGLAVWIDTLKTRANLLVVWSRESTQTQSLLQQKVCEDLLHCVFSFLHRN